MKKVQNIVFACSETYTDREGNRKRTFTTIGTAFTDDHGRVSLKFDFIPVDFNKGFINLMDLPTKD